jgi:hypothetical protein
MKKPIHALSFAPDVEDWLENSHHPRILHIFDHACNLINERGEVLSIVTPQIGNGPFNLVVENEVNFIDYIHLESGVFISPTQVILGNLSVHTENAKLWNPQPNWERLYHSRDEIADELKKLPITNSQFSNLSSPIVNANLSSAKTLTRELAGLGIGLTPSGDDFIVGALYAMWIIHPREIAGILAQELAATAAPLTTSLSAAWLRSAGKGEAGVLWHAFFDALVSNDQIRIKESMENILSVGETSGADALAGFASVLMTWMERESSSRG